MPSFFSSSSSSSSIIPPPSQEKLTNGDTIPQSRCRRLRSFLSSLFTGHSQAITTAPTNSNVGQTEDPSSTACPPPPAPLLLLESRFSCSGGEGEGNPTTTVQSADDLPNHHTSDGAASSTAAIATLTSIATRPAPNSSTDKLPTADDDTQLGEPLSREWSWVSSSDFVVRPPEGEEPSKPPADPPCPLRRRPRVRPIRRRGIGPASVRPYEMSVGESLTPPSPVPSRPVDGGRIFGEDMTSGSDKTRNVDADGIHDGMPQGVVDAESWETILARHAVFTTLSEPLPEDLHEME
ncbi:hypothetical protein TWF696_003041 [Orbilia brochopaga]|uniref:Uncharacterized protein n=1 Tax=Orbilia brochopaga TaxID=3140254 RepID=A0AAV9U2K1_9PEZI